MKYIVGWDFDIILKHCFVFRKVSLSRFKPLLKSLFIELFEIIYFFYALCFCCAFIINKLGVVVIFLVLNIAERVEYFFIQIFHEFELLWEEIFQIFVDTPLARPV